MASLEAQAERRCPHPTPPQHFFWGPKWEARWHSEGNIHQNRPLPGPNVLIGAVPSWVSPHFWGDFVRLILRPSPRVTLSEAGSRGVRAHGIGCPRTCAKQRGHSRFSSNWGGSPKLGAVTWPFCLYTVQEGGPTKTKQKSSHLGFFPSCVLKRAPRNSAPNATSTGENQPCFTQGQDIEHCKQPLCPATSPVTCPQALQCPVLSGQSLL